MTLFQAMTRLVVTTYFIRLWGADGAEFWEWEVGNA